MEVEAEVTAETDAETDAEPDGATRPMLLDSTGVAVASSMAGMADVVMDVGCMMGLPFGDDVAGSPKLDVLDDAVAAVVKLAAAGDILPCS